MANHVSWADALIILATQQRRIRFLMYRVTYERMVLLRPLFKLMRVILISYADNPKKIVASLKEARDALDEGYIVCIFAEGALTRTGNMMPFRSGFERILRGSDHPVVPVYIGGAWGSIFSYYHGSIMGTLPTRFPYPVSIRFGAPMPATTDATTVHRAVQELSGEYFNGLKTPRRSLARVFLRTARRHWRLPAISDTSGKDLDYGRAAIGAFALARRLAEPTAGQEKVGILLPASVGGALANVATTLLGKVPVNLNFTASRDAVDYAIKACEIRCIVSSRAFLERLDDFEAPPGVVYLEDLLTSISGRDRLVAFLKARCLPVSMVVGTRGFSPDNLATVIFSSGTTGTPKGVMLSHHNVIANVEALRMVFHTNSRDNMCAALPFFHSFGFTGTLWFPLASGFSAAYHPNPLDGQAIADLVRERQSTLLLATPTFLTAYIRRAKAKDFASLRAVVVGAEKLKSRVADSFEKKFGTRPMEGYGATELSPVAAVNTPDVELDGLTQIGRKDGSVGRPVPGVAINVVDEETGEPRPVGTAGLLLLKGPNVMLGYLNDPDRTAAVLRDGWYNTGDIAAIDADGFITITDRLSRFSKIGGEMVPHLAIEEIYANGLGTTELSVAVTAIADERKGEKLVVLHLASAGDAESLHRIIADSDVPNLWKPQPQSYVSIDEMPLLGSGKLDLKRLKEMAAEAGV